MQTSWADWPPRAGLSRERESQPRRLLSVLTRLVLLVVVVWGTYAPGRFTDWWAAGIGAGIVLFGALFAAYFQATLARRRSAAVGLAVLLLVFGWVANSVEAFLLADLVWCTLAVTALVRLPLVVGAPIAAACLGSYALASWESWISILATVGGLALLGYLLRLDAEAAGAAHHMLQRERAARAAEAESAALAERTRIAREIHDVLAHSLSAQLVHLEAARLMLDTGAERERVRERVVAARRMAQDGLAETRQALSALRGEFAPVGEFLVELTRREGAEFAIEGVARPLPAETGLAVSRTAQEAFTNVRKHAPGARVSVRLAYLEGAVELEVRNTRPPRGAAAPGLADAGSGYGLLGMRERAELLGGELLAGQEDGGWRVLLRVPA
ncbi:two-component sensor histidine kinase [Kitasatospora sp. MMS16-BH015]|uniref:sensor histidine kinase n=1 Tax=Kitasatospora sp. MMS16-BH015 TaxID=2018025 RepID=UPI000CA330FE|nr:sensor histidine kinase [Kitasatospora sp. MMS16-BH015]AUG79973.1 two-component sensor histidine kinase [Kitasatospora sp. MMS16-BH015]